MPVGAPTRLKRSQNKKKKDIAQAKEDKKAADEASELAEQSAANLVQEAAAKDKDVIF